MDYIASLMAFVDTVVASVGQSAYDQVGAALMPAFQLSAVLVIAILGINLMIQAVPMSLANGVNLIVRLSVVMAFLPSWANFSLVYMALTQAPEQIGGVVLSTLGYSQDIAGLYPELDRLLQESLDLGQAVVDGSGYISGALASIAIVGVTMITLVVAVGILIIAKTVLAVMIVVAPVAIAATLFKQSAPLFEGWIKVSLGAAMVSLLVAAALGVVIAFENQLSPGNSENVAAIGDALGFVFAMGLGLLLLRQVPGWAEALAQTRIEIGAVARNAERMGTGAARLSSGAVRDVGAGMRGAAEAGIGRELPQASSAARQVGYNTVDKVRYLASRMR